MKIRHSILLFLATPFAARFATMTFAAEECPLGRPAAEVFKTGWSSGHPISPEFPFNWRQVYEKGGTRTEVDEIDGKIVRLRLETKDLVGSENWEQTCRSWLNAIFPGIKDDQIQRQEGGYSCSFKNHLYQVGLEEWKNREKKYAIFIVGDAEFFATPKDVGTGQMKPEKLHAIRSALFD